MRRTFYFKLHPRHEEEIKVEADYVLFKGKHVIFHEVMDYEGDWHRIVLAKHADYVYDLREE